MELIEYVSHQILISISDVLLPGTSCKMNDLDSCSSNEVCVPTPANINVSVCVCSIGFTFNNESKACKREMPIIIDGDCAKYLQLVLMF